MAVATFTPAAPSVLIGILWKTASAVVFTLMLTLVKILAERVPVGEILFARSFFGLIPVLVMIAFSGGLRTALTTAHPFGHAKRAVAGVLAMGLWFAALERLPLPEATAIVYVAPLIMVVFAATLLGETVRIHRWSAVIVGFLGVVVVILPQISSGFDVMGQSSSAGAALALTAAVFMALATVFVRQLTGTEPTVTIVFYFFLSSSVLSLATLPFGWMIPSWHDAMLLVIMGCLGGVGQIMLTTAFRYAEASVIAPFEYTSMIWAVIISYVVFAEPPKTIVLIGAAIVIASGIYVILRERQLGLQRRERALGTLRN